MQTLSARGMQVFPKAEQFPFYLYSICAAVASLRICRRIGMICSHVNMIMGMHAGFVCVGFVCRNACPRYPLRYEYASKRTSTCKPLGKACAKFESCARRMRLRGLVCAFDFVCGAQRWEQLRQRSRDQRRELRMLGEPRCRFPEGYASGGSPPGGICQRGLPARRKMPARAPRMA